MKLKVKISLNIEARIDLSSLLPPSPSSLAVAEREREESMKYERLKTTMILWA